MTDDPIMRGVIDANRARRRKGWKSSGEVYDSSRIEGASREFIEWMKAQQEAQSTAAARSS